MQGSAMGFFIAVASLGWVGLLLVRWRPWGTSEQLEPAGDRSDEDRGDVTVLITERNEAGVIERRLVPAFVYFFKLIYPFRLGNDPRSQFGVAAGGCILLRSSALQKIGGFEPLRAEIIDDCSLARRIKRGGGRTWTGLSHSVRS